MHRSASLLPPCDSAGPLAGGSAFQELFNVVKKVGLLLVGLACDARQFRRAEVMKILQERRSARLIGLGQNDDDPTISGEDEIVCANQRFRPSCAVLNFFMFMSSRPQYDYRKRQIVFRRVDDFLLKALEEVFRIGSSRSAVSL